MSEMVQKISELKGIIVCNDTVHLYCLNYSYDMHSLYTKCITKNYH